MSSKKDDSSKLPHHLIPAECEDFLAAVLNFGQVAYDANNWQGLDNFFDRYYSANRRHHNKRREGEIFDKDSGLPHYAHALCCDLFLLWKDLQSLTKEQREQILKDVPQKAREYVFKREQALSIIERPCDTTIRGSHKIYG